MNKKDKSLFSLRTVRLVGLFILIAPIVWIFYPANRRY